MTIGWPVRLRYRDIGLRPLTVRDAPTWESLRRRNLGWLGEWEATQPPEAGGGRVTFRGMTRALVRQARQGRALPFVLTFREKMVGQVTATGISWGSARWAQIGYWIDESYAGRGITPIAVALVCDHCLFTMRLHRLEIAIRPENTASLRVVEKLGIPLVGKAPRYLHINGAWRDHLLFALTAEDVDASLLTRLGVPTE